MHGITRQSTTMCDEREPRDDTRTRQQYVAVAGSIWSVIFKRAPLTSTCETLLFYIASVFICSDRACLPVCLQQGCLHHVMGVVKSTSIPP